MYYFGKCVLHKTLKVRGPVKSITKVKKKCSHVMLKLVLVFLCGPQTAVHLNDRWQPFDLSH